ncbi:hypothetical protein BAE44_0025682 [Dichanthelium oligosanthes]|uniref:Uncharacterized protein n=1 Tax=Dichanthelium oligosanthes TaxID=888268 RepID=A0A1E5UK90_9POAL|nr:hypothetical protein BAE44_0025682 [Dichanthelium oligosanthes]
MAYARAPRPAVRPPAAADPRRRRLRRAPGVPRQGPPAPASGDRPEWLFFFCRGRGLGSKRRAGPGAYRLASEAKPRGAWYCHSFRYHEDSAEASAARETERRMDEYGDRGAAGDGAFDMVVCKV